MRTLVPFILLLFTCVSSLAQVNYVLNGDLEKYSRCPDAINNIYRADGWRNPRDSTMGDAGMEYYNSCGNKFADLIFHVPENVNFVQVPHSGNGMAGAHLYFDKDPSSTGPPPLPLPYNYRDYLQGHLVNNLVAGKRYCITFYVNPAEGSGYSHNKIGAYLDDGSINFDADTPGKEILSIVPQVHTEDVVLDTARWTKIEGSFVAAGNETYITVGNFYPNSDITTTVTYYWPGFKNYSYYLIDDVSVVESDHKADAGLDTWVEETKTVKIGPADDTTATAIDCKWFHKGFLIDSGAVISVPAASAKGIIDTYVVVQTICGNVTTDTVLVSTVGLGVRDPGFGDQFRIFPNPSNGKIYIVPKEPQSGLILTITDPLGRIAYNGAPKFSGNTIELQINVPQGVYLLQVSDGKGHYFRQRISIR